RVAEDLRDAKPEVAVVACTDRAAHRADVVAGERHVLREHAASYRDARAPHDGRAVPDRMPDAAHRDELRAPRIEVDVLHVTSGEGGDHDGAQRIAEVRKARRGAIRGRP